MTEILIVDDQVTNREIFAKLAASIEPDITVQTFTEPRSALAWLETHTPDLIITDYKMPEMDGAEFIAALRRYPLLSDIPIVVITVFEERSFRLRALVAGATDFLQSPVDHQEFLTRARNLLKMRKQQLLLASRADDLKRELEVSERSREEVLRDSRDRLAQVIDTVPSMISASDRNGTFIFMNAYQGDVFGIDPASAIGRDAATVLGPESGARNNVLDRLVFENGKTLSGIEEEMIDRRGERRVFLTTKSPLRDAGGAITGVLTSSIDISERKHAEQHLFHMAHHDALTGLPNRTLLRDRLRRATNRARLTDQSVALHLIDLDSFKGVNDLLGHSTGDQLLKSVGQRLRSMTGPDDIVARLGGDEFAVLQAGITSPEQAKVFAERIGKIIANPFELGGESVTSTASIGITLYPADGSEFDELLKNADIAMYKAKGNGGDQHCFYTANMRTHERQSVLMNTRLRQALIERQFSLYYQPQINLATGEVIGAEALLRWILPSGEIVSPGNFLPRAEENGLILPINEWVLFEACQQAHSWQRMGLKGIQVGVNLSGVQFQKRNVPLLVARVLAESGLNPALLDLELTESIVLQDADDVVAQLHQLRALGVQLSVDDFGTGYSSLSYIKNFPVTTLKIDQSFVRNLMADSSDRAIIRALIGLGHSLNLKVVAEGIETAEQQQHLLAEGCDIGQGYYFGRPMPAADFIAFAQKSSAMRKSA